MFFSFTQQIFLSKFVIDPIIYLLITFSSKIQRWLSMLLKLLFRSSTQQLFRVLSLKMIIEWNMKLHFLGSKIFHLYFPKSSFNNFLKQKTKMIIDADWTEVLFRCFTWHFYASVFLLNSSSSSNNFVQQNVTKFDPLFSSSKEI